jgi:hypothetical protein
MPRVLSAKHREGRLSTRLQTSSSLRLSRVRSRVRSDSFGLFCRFWRRNSGSLGFVFEPDFRLFFELIPNGICQLSILASFSELVRQNLAICRITHLSSISCCFGFVHQITKKGAPQVQLLPRWRAGMVPDAFPQPLSGSFGFVSALCRFWRRNSGSFGFVFEPDFRSFFKIIPN